MFGAIVNQWSIFVCLCSAPTETGASNLSHAGRVAFLTIPAAGKGGDSPKRYANLDGQRLERSDAPGAGSKGR